jgi:hypothetical protein
VSDKAHDNLVERSSAVIAEIQARDEKQRQVAAGTYVEPKKDEGKPAEVEMDAATLAKLTEASEKERAARVRAERESAKVKELEAASADVATIRDIKKLWKEGKRGAAIKLLSEGDYEKDAEEFLKEWTAEGSADAETKLSREEIDAIRAEQETAKKDRDARAAREKAEEDGRNAQRFSAQIRDTKNQDGTAKYPLASKPENSDEARTVALEKANARLLKLKISGPISRELADDLLHHAMSEVEANLAKAAAPPIAEPKPNVQQGNGVPAPRAGTAPATEKTYPRTPEGASARLHDSARRLGLLP